ncbi:MAG TPA: DNA-binding protein, partial [Candidatus Hydrogenedentes bacterium]|nr:DNA-binding protein [Candidatus Hydrogenedentota bacterium]
MPVMLDSCVYLDIFTRDKHWYAWSSEVLSSAANKGTIVINPIIYAEISIRFERIEELEQVLPPDVFDYRPISREV